MTITFLPGGNGGSRVPVVFSGSPFSTLAALEAAAQASPSDLINESSRVSVAVVAGDPNTANDGNYEWRGEDGVYASGGWFNVSPLNGADRAAVDSIQSLKNNTVPISMGGVLTESPITMNTATDVMESTAPFKLPGGGALEFDNNDMSSGGTVSGGAAGVRFTNRSDDTQGYLVSVPFVTATGSGTPFYDKFGPEIVAPSAADKSDTRDARFDFINPLPGIVTEYTVSRPAGSPTLTDCNFTIWLEGYNTGTPLFDYKESNPGGGGFTLAAGENVVTPPVPIGFPANIDPNAPANEQIRLYSEVVDSSGNLVQLEGQVITIPAAPDPRAEQQWLPFLGRKVHFSERVTLVDDIEHPVTLRRDMPTAVDAQRIVESSLNGNSALWIIANDQILSSNRADATIVAQRAGFLDLDGNEIPTTPVAANTIRLRSGTIVRIFAANDYRVVNSPVFESDITNGGTSPTTPQPSFERFAFQSQPTSVAPGTVVSGNKTFNIRIDRPDLLTGNLKISQDGRTLSENTLALTTTSTTLNIDLVTLTNAGDTTVFTIEANKASGGVIRAHITIRAYQPHDLAYWGIRPTQDFADVSLNDLTSVDITTNNQFDVTGAFANQSYIGVMVPSTHDVREITTFNLPATSEFTRTANARTINSVTYILYTLQNNGGVDGSAAYVVEV